MTSPPTTRRGLVAKALVGLAITVALVVFLLRYVDVDQIGALFATMRWPPWLAGFGLWLLIYLVRAVRFRLMAPRTPLGVMFHITAVHNFLLRLLPMRTGELSYAFLVRRAGTAGLGESLLSLLLLRALDATVVVVVFTAALSVHQGAYLGERRIGIAVAAAAALVGVVGVIGLGRLLQAGLTVARAVASWVRLDRSARVRDLLARIGHAVDTFRAIGPRVTLQAAGVTLILWLLTFSAFFAIMRAFSMPVGLAETVLGSTAAVVTGFLPIGGIGSFGTLEAGWALGFALVGLDQQRAVASGFGVSLTTFGYAAVLGLAGWIGLITVGKKRDE